MTGAAWGRRHRLRQGCLVDGKTASFDDRVVGPRGKKHSYISVAAGRTASVHPWYHRVPKLRPVAEAAALFLNRRLLTLDASELFRPVQAVSCDKLFTVATLPRFVPQRIVFSQCRLLVKPIFDPPEVAVPPWVVLLHDLGDRWLLEVLAQLRVLLGCLVHIVRFQSEIVEHVAVCDEPTFSIGIDVSGADLLREGRYRVR